VNLKNETDAANQLKETETPKESYSNGEPKDRGQDEVEQVGDEVDSAKATIEMRRTRTMFSLCSRGSKASEVRNVSILFFSNL